jgi:hypothetical protein
VKVSHLHMLMQSCLRWMSDEPDKELVCTPTRPRGRSATTQSDSASRRNSL